MLFLDWLERIPALVKLGFAAAGFLVTAFSSRLPEYLQDWGLWSGLALGVIALIGLALHAIKDFRKGDKVSAPDLIILGLGGIVIFAAIALAGVIWNQKSAAKTVPVEQAQSPAPQPPSSPPQIATAAYDVPKKLTIIDAFLDILKNDIGPQLIAARKLQQDWKSRIQTSDNRVAFMRKMAEFRQGCEDVRIKINKLQNDNRHFEDIFVLLEQDYVGKFFRGMDQFQGAIGSVGDPPYKMDLDFFVKSYADDFRKGIEELSNWYGRKSAQAIQIRKRFSS